MKGGGRREIWEGRERGVRWRGCEVAREDGRKGGREGGKVDFDERFWDPDRFCFLIAVFGPIDFDQWDVTFDVWSKVDGSVCGGVCGGVCGCLGV